MAFQWSLAALETLMAEDQMDQHAAVLRAFSVVELWRLRRVCRAFHRWGTAALAALPRVVAVSGGDAGCEPAAGVEVLDLSGRRVRQVYEGADKIGVYARAWDGRDDVGRRVPPGIYLFRVDVDTDAGGESAVGVIEMAY